MGTITKKEDKGTQGVNASQTKAVNGELLIQTPALFIY